MAGPGPWRSSRVTGNAEQVLCKLTDLETMPSVVSDGLSETGWGAGRWLGIDWG